MSNIYEILCDENGRIIYDKLGNPMKVLVGFVDDSPKETIWQYQKRIQREKEKAEALKALEKQKQAEKKRALKEAKKKQASLQQRAQAESFAEEWFKAPKFEPKVMFNDAGVPITMKNGYSSEDVFELSKNFELFDEYEAERE